MSTFKISRSPHRHGAPYIATFVTLSLLIHGLLFFTFTQWQREDKPRPADEPRQAPISVRLLEAVPQAPQLAGPVHEPQSVPLPPAPPKSAARPKTATKTAKIKRAHPQTPQLAQTEQPAIQEKAVRAPSPEMDMMKMLDAARERRRAARQIGSMDDVQVSASPANDIALANISRDLQRTSGRWTGVGGVFRIVSKGVRTAQFQFLGWNPGAGNSWRQTFEVDAGPNGDVELATVQKMIELIRSHYSGDFNWESHRLGRVLVLSARPSDNAELEAFLMREFFGS